jgi:DNA-binding response OmpR family regulator
MSHQIDEYDQAGVDGVVSKPIRVEDLYAALQAVLDRVDSDAADAA